MQGIAIVLFLVIASTGIAYGVGTDKNGDINHNISVSSSDADTADGEETEPELRFEAVFAIAGLLAIAYLVLRKRT